MRYELNDGASVDRVSESTTTRDAKGADHVANSGDVILSGSDGAKAVIPSAVFDSVFSESESDSSSSSPVDLPPTDSGPSSETPEPSTSPDAPDAPTADTATA